MLSTGLDAPAPHLGGGDEEPIMGTRSGHHGAAAAATSKTSRRKAKAKAKKGVARAGAARHDDRTVGLLDYDESEA